MRHRLKDSQCRAAFEPGRLADGDGLYLSVSRTGSKSWVFLYTREGRRREIGLGSVRSNGTAPVSLGARAREKADAIRARTWRPAFDPLEKKRAAATRGRSTTFGEMADRFLADKAKERKNEKHRAQWAMTLREYAKPLRSKPVASITENDVKNCLAPIWTEKKRDGTAHDDSASRWSSTTLASYGTAKARIRPGGRVTWNCCFPRSRNSKGAITPPCPTSPLAGRGC